MYTQAQSDALLTQRGATFVADRQGVQWWKLPDGSWIARRATQPGYVELRSFPANACNC
jgi:hypothetical protein